MPKTWAPAIRHKINARAAKYTEQRFMAGSIAKLRAKTNNSWRKAGERRPRLEERGTRSSFREWRHATYRWTRLEAEKALVERRKEFQRPLRLYSRFYISILWHNLTFTRQSFGAGPHNLTLSRFSRKTKFDAYASNFWSGDTWHSVISLIDRAVLARLRKTCHSTAVPLV